MHVPQRSFASLLLTLVLATGCQGVNHTTDGAAVGTGLGALAGGIIGNQSGQAAEGALIGALAGAAGGALVGNAQDNQERAEAWKSYAEHSERVQHEQARALSASDVITMSNNENVNDSIIIQSIQQRGVKFDANKDYIIYLADRGVSPTVISAIQRYGH